MADTIPVNDLEHTIFLSLDYPFIEHSDVLCKFVLSEPGPRRPFIYFAFFFASLFASLPW